MANVYIRIRKEYNKYNFDNGDSVEVQGIRVILAPKIEKFIPLENLTKGNKSNFELLEYCNPDLAHWYHNSPVGTEMSLIENYKKSIPVSDESSGISAIYTNSSNQL